MLFDFLRVASLVLQNGPPAPPGPQNLPKGDEVQVDTELGEVRFAAKVRNPKDEPCIDAFGQRIQAFVGSAKAGGHPSEFVDHFVFLAPADTEAVYRGLTEVGATSKVHFSRAEGRERAGKDYLQGDPVESFIGWQEGDRRVERRYEDLMQEKVVVDGREVVRPWKPRFVFHGSGVIH